MHPCNQNKFMFISSCIKNNKNFKHIKFINEIFPKLNQMSLFMLNFNLINGSSKPGAHRTKCQIANYKQYYIFKELNHSLKFKELNHSLKHFIAGCPNHSSANPPNVLTGNSQILVNYSKVTIFLMYLGQG